MSRLMAIDYGESRIGIALTDPLKMIASGFETIKNDHASFDKIIDIYCRKLVSSVVIGIPFDQESQIGPAAEKVLLFAQKLACLFQQKNITPVFYEQDERYTTRQALTDLKTMKVKKKRQRNVVDQVAAVNILRSFMESNYKTELNFDKYLKSTGKSNGSI